MAQTAFIKASFKVRGGDGEPIPVHFNPQTLQYAITNTLSNSGSGNSTKQYVSASTGKLSMELVYDTTDSGEDVRLHTVRVAELMEPGESDKTPPVVEFEWGLYKFAGMIESYKETLDFFSADGIPLRASLGVTLSSQDQVFEGGSAERRAATGGRLGDAGGVDAPAPGASDGRGVTEVATRGGAPAAGRAIAAANGLESMRFPGTASVELGAGVQVGAAASLSLGAGATTGAAFEGLRLRAGAARGASINVENFLRGGPDSTLRTDDGAAFSLGGQVQAMGSASYKADVGIAGALKSRLEFDGEN